MFFVETRMGYSQRHLVVFEESECTKSRQLTVTFKFDNRLSDCSNKAVLVRLSDEDDLYFLYTVSISDKDFINIKAQQGLLVDFDGFSQKVVDLLELCRQEENNNTAKYVLKFSRVFENGRKIGMLRIVEATNFKYLTHLSLNLFPADDELLKTYLVEQLKNLRLQSTLRCNDLEETLKRTTSHLAKTEQILTQTQKEFQDYRSEAESRENTMVTSYEAKLGRLEKTLSMTIASFETSATAEKNTALESMERMRSEFQAKLSTSEQEVMRLSKEQTQLLASLSNVKEKLQVSCEKNASLVGEISVLRSKLDLSEKTNHDQASTVTRLESRVNALESELSNKNNLLSKTQDLLSAEQEQKTCLQDQLQRQLRHLEKVEKALEKESEEVNKANEIIRRLQNEVKSHHTKSKLRGQVAAEQERLLSSKETELQDIHNELERVKSDLKAARDSADSLNSQLKSKCDELAEAQRTIKTNENIISWLNRQISESQMGQMQQRLKTSGFPTPIPPLPNGNGRLFSPAFGTGMSAGWQTAGSRLTNNLTGSTQTGITPGASSVLGTSSRPASSVPVAFAGLSSTGTSTVPTSALRQVPESEYEMGYKKSVKTVESGNSNSLKSTEANPCNLPAPVTKSTPLHGDHMITSKAYPSDGPGRSVRTTTATTTASAGDMSSRLPAYLPSVLTLRSQTNQNQATTSAVPRVPYPDRISQEAGRPTAATTTSACSGPDESERTVHQQSLSSAYFPKPVGVQSQR